MKEAALVPSDCMPEYVGLLVFTSVLRPFLPFLQNIHGLGKDSHVIRLIQKPQMRNRHPNTSIILNILHQHLRKRPPPITTRARMPRAPTQIAPPILIPIRLHEPRRAPRIRINSANAIRHRLLREPHLAPIIAIELVAGGSARRSGAGGEDAVAGAAGADAVPDYGEACAGGGAEEVVEALFAGGGGEGLELGGAAEGLGDAETVDLLELGGGVDGDGGLGEGWDGVG